VVESHLSDRDELVDQLVRTLSEATTLSTMPEAVDVVAAAPANPPESIQQMFVGASYRTAYAEAATFVKVADQWSTRHTGAGLATQRCTIDFGAGWGRITRMLLAFVPPTGIHALDVDPTMTTLVNATLPGVNALTVGPLPPTALRSALADGMFAFSVFSHLAPDAHAAWAYEFGRLVVPGAMVFLTVLDETFFRRVRRAKAAVDAGGADVFTTDLARVLDDVHEAEQAFGRGEAVYAGVGGGGVRTGDFYGWTVSPVQYVERRWAAAGFDIVEWVRSDVLFPQAMVGLRKRR
jgi:hypothetical protein